MKRIENKKICSECGGDCCKNLPGNYYPSDFDLPEENPTKNDFKKLKKIISKETIAIDWWEGLKSPKYFLRPSIKDVKRKFDPSWGGECIFLTDSGCKLPYNKRPLECRKLEPIETGDCYMHGGLNKKLHIKHG
jgi:Fe-S-cluster containining protein